jgi:uncharacterized membrane protein YvbJ
MRCTRCGTDNPPGKSVCRKCGNFLYANYPNNRVPLTPEQRKARRRSLFKNSTVGCLWMILVVVGVLIVLGIISFVLVNYILPDDFFSSMTTTTSVTETATGTTTAAEGTTGTTADITTTAGQT